MTKEIIENNKLLAKFMEINVVEADWPTKTLLRVDENKNVDFEHLIEYCPNSDWNDLMKVVEKIENHKIAQEAYGFEFSIKGKRCITISNSTTGVDVVVIGFRNYNNNTWYSKIEASWLACIEFVKWYNKQCNIN